MRSRFKEFQEAREALLKGDIKTGNDAAGRMPTTPEGFVSSFEYAGELALDFMQPVADRGLLDVTSEEQRAGHRIQEDVEGYLRHLHLNNATGEGECEWGNVDWRVESDRSFLCLLRRYIARCQDPHGGMR